MYVAGLANAPDPRMWTARRSCTWVEQGGGLWARMCSDGEVIMWKDDQRNVWLPTEKPPKRWRTRFKAQQLRDCALGAATTPGVCPERKTVKPAPLATIRRLQNALRGLGGRVKDAALKVTADGLIGPRTITATNRAMQTYAPGFTSGTLSRAEVLRNAPQLAAWIEKAPYTNSVAARTAAMASRAAAAASGATSAMIHASRSAVAAGQDPANFSPPQGDQAMPAPGYYPVQPGYAPAPTYYPPPAYGPHAPAGLPTDRASLDVRAFIPAQYEHIRLSPGTGTAIVAVGVVLVYLLMRDKKHKKD